ncbi:hypothetical protein BX616_002032 [Lobosporangium transversale]|uniref:Uncharacterized protein n=1 Tax=Lobosporangium transversale TaxID=64571 RepID=A0A1Y2G8I2_9FUNG|nr:hypothetical protein BCR41DRAFT_426054 [Lobosporangium transversale]KAF9902097.1 hypothetical protein BX616_002032 [Lobosporangium transversale]ORZ04218.1 hypothetical protein BCR41DRAFT_426054 [Lobosporangium transversale]|eukprot:XP_021876432.1 hypothetical protein BCR41DRAFT_426054 [Lobosporangium transversale]
MNHNSHTYYQNHHDDDEGYDQLVVDEDEEYQEDLFLQKHYGPPRTIGGLGLVHDDDDDESDEDEDVYNANHSYHAAQNPYHGNAQSNNFHHGQSALSDSGEEEVEIYIEDEYNEMDMDHHNIQLLNGSLSVRSPFLDAIREEEDEEPVFANPSSYPSLGSGRHFQRLSNGGLKNGQINDGSGGFNPWNNNNSRQSSLSMALAEKHLQQKQEQQQQQQQQQQKQVREQGAMMIEQQQANFNSMNQNDDSKPRGPRPPLMLGRPRSNTSSLPRLTTGFDVPSSTTSTAAVASSTIDQDTMDVTTMDLVAKQNKAKDALRESQMSPENAIQDLEVKRVLEGSAALASATAAASLSKTAVPAVAASFSSSSSSPSHGGPQSTDSTPLPSSAALAVNAATITSTSDSKPFSSSNGADDKQVATASFGQDTQRSIDDFFGMVKSDLDKRIQEAIQEVEQKFLNRVQRLEQHTATLTGMPPPNINGDTTGDGSNNGDIIDLASLPKSTMDVMTQNPKGSLALRKEILSHVTEKVGDLDLRVNQMEVLVSYKLVDIESKVQDLHGAHNSIAQKVHQVAKSHKSNMQGVRAGDGVGEDTIAAEEARISAAMQPYREIDAQGNEAEAFLEPIDSDVDENSSNSHEGVVSIRERSARAGGSANGSSELVDASTAIVDLRKELRELGMRYQELNDGLLTDLMGQMRDAKLMLFQTVDEVDGRISKRVDRIEAEMHSKLLSEIEGRMQERVRAMEQTSARLEKCFDRMEGRLGALETVLASRRPRPESMYQLMQQQFQQHQHQHQHQSDSGVSGSFPQRAGTFSGFPSSPPSSGHMSVTSVLFSAEADINGDQGALSTTLTNGYNPSRGAIVSSPTESIYNSSQVKPIWMPSHNTSTSSSSSYAYKNLSTSVPLVASPLERGTVIGDRIGTIHPENISKVNHTPTTPVKDKFQNSIPITPIKERFQNLLAASSSSMTTPSGSTPSSSAAAAAVTTTTTTADQRSVGQASRLRRVSLSSFDANSLSALKPVRPTTATCSTTATAVTATPAALSIITTTTANTTSSHTPRSSNGSSASTRSNSSSSISSKGTSVSESSRSKSPEVKRPSSASSTRSTSSLLTAKLNSVGSNAGIGSGSGSGSSAGHSTTRTMQRAMTFDTLQSKSSISNSLSSSVSSSMSSPVMIKTNGNSSNSKPTQGPSSYRDLLHFWKAGGSANAKVSQGAAA